MGNLDDRGMSSPSETKTLFNLSLSLFSLSLLSLSLHLTQLHSAALDQTRWAKGNEGREVRTRCGTDKKEHKGCRWRLDLADDSALRLPLPFPARFHAVMTDFEALKGADNHRNGKP